MPSYMVRSQFLSCVEVPKFAKFVATPLINLHSYALYYDEAGRKEVKVTLSGPSRDETLPLREKTKF